MGVEAKTNNYWIAPNAISISLNALGYENRIYGSVASGSVISCYMDSVAPGGDNGDGLGLDNGRNPKRWPLTISPTYFNSDTPKYVYVAIPRRSSFGTQAIVVFPSEQIDIYGKNESDEQIGSVDYFYIWLRGIISAPVEKNGTLQREWTQQIIWGSLGTYQDIIDLSGGEWYEYSKALETVTFLKRIVMKAGSFFQNIFLGDQDHELTGAATAATPGEFIDSDTLVATPSFIGQHYLRKDADDEATGLIGFIKGLWIKAAGLFGFSEDGDVVARSIKATGSSGETVADIDNSTRKNLGLEVAESGIIGGILRVAKNILTKTIQSLNFTGGDSMFGTGWQLTDNDGNGNSRLIVDNLFVRMKAVFNELEVRKFVSMGGNYVFSPAASIIEEVDYIDADGNVLGYEYVKVPWVLRLVPLSLAGKFLSRKKLVRSTMSQADWDRVKVFRCWIKADDGTTRTINTWQVGMLARCQTFDVSQGSGTQSGTWYGQNVKNKLYWRAVTAIGTAITKQNYSLQNHILDDGLKHNYIDLANYTDENNVQLYLTGSDNPEALDNIVCYGDWLDRTLSNLISIETVGSEAPCIREVLEVGYTNGQSIDWSLTNKERTRISPTAGNKFVAPSFVVTTEGSADESLYVERYKGTAFKTQFVQGQEVAMAPDGSIVLLAYSDIEAQNALKTLHISPPSVDNPAYGFVWESSKARLGDAYVNQADGHRYVATATGWEDRGLNDESMSTLKVDINSITAKVESEIGGLATELNLTSDQIALVSLVNYLETAGVHIDGLNSTIIAKADNFEVQNSSGSVTFSIDADGNIVGDGNASFSGNLNAAGGTFAGTLSGVTGTFAGTLTSTNDFLQLTTSRSEAGNVTWRGLAVMGREEGVIDLGDIATFGARIGNDVSAGRIALAKRVVTRSGDTATVTATIPIVLDADDGSIEATSVEADEIEVDNAKVNTSLDIAGIVTGLRLYVKTITAGSSYTPKPKEGIIIINTSNDFNLVLPSPGGEYVGKFYLIRNKNTSYDLTVSCANGSDILYGNDGTPHSYDTITRPTTLCFSDGSNWIMMYSDY